MAPARKKTKQKGSLTKTIESDVFEDKKARNLMSVDLKKTVKKSKIPTKKPGTKKARVYTEKELGIPTLNKAINPEGVKIAKRGKKGKIFADQDKMLQIVKSVNLHLDSRNASKLEKARQLEEIREAKRKEIEQKEQEKESKLSKKKSELKRQRRGKKPVAGQDDENSSSTQDNSRPTVDHNDKKKRRLRSDRKKVSFA